MGEGNQLERAGYAVYGIEASWFTGKLRVMLRSRGITHRFELKRPEVSKRVSARAGTHQMPVLETPEGWVIADTTPIAHMLDAWFPSSAMLPADPVHRVATMILEDWFDEWWTRPGMYYRWQFEASTEDAMLRIGRESGPEGLDDAQARNIGGIARAWAQKSCRAIGAEGANGPEIEARFERHLAAMDAHFAEHDFFFGDRPTLADLALAGGFMAHLYADVVPRALIDRLAPRVPQWLERLWNPTPGHLWPRFEAPAGPLTPLVVGWLEEIAGDFHSYMRVNGEALAAGQKGVMVPFADGAEISLRCMPYLETTRRFTMARIAELTPSARAEVIRALGPTGALAVYDL